MSQNLQIYFKNIYRESKHNWVLIMTTIECETEY